MTIGFYASKLLLMSCRPSKAINIPLQKHVKTINQTMHPFQLMQIRQNIMWIKKYIYSCTCVFTKPTKCIYNFIKGCFAAKSDKWLFIVCIKSLNLKSMPSACPLSWDWFLSSNSPLCSIQMIFCNKSFKCNNDSSTSLSTYCLWQLGF